MEIRPTCSVSECGSLGVYRCGSCQRTFCSQHALVVSKTSPMALWVPGVCVLPSLLSLHSRTRSFGGCVAME
jgi:hypothetical protein